MNKATRPTLLTMEQVIENKLKDVSPSAQAYALVELLAELQDSLTDEQLLVAIDRLQDAAVALKKKVERETRQRLMYRSKTEINIGAGQAVIGGVVVNFTAHIDSCGHIADVYVRVNNESIQHVNQVLELYDSKEFENAVFQAIKEKTGYEGKQFGRAELGMQMGSVVVLEPNKEFTEFVCNKLGFVKFTA
jgi:hypothetical protein